MSQSRTLTSPALHDPQHLLLKGFGPHTDSIHISTTWQKISKYCTPYIVCMIVKQLLSTSTVLFFKRTYGLIDQIAYPKQHPCKYPAKMPRAVKYSLSTAIGTTQPGSPNPGRITLSICHVPGTNAFVFVWDRILTSATTASIHHRMDHLSMRSCPRAASRDPPSPPRRRHMLGDELATRLTGDKASNSRLTSPCPVGRVSYFSRPLFLPPRDGCAPIIRDRDSRQAVDSEEPQTRAHVSVCVPRSAHGSGVLDGTIRRAAGCKGDGSQWVGGLQANGSRPTCSCHTQVDKAGVICRCWITRGTKKAGRVRPWMVNFEATPQPERGGTTDTARASWEYIHPLLRTPADKGVSRVQVSLKAR